MIAGDAAQDPERVRRFEQEAHAIAALDHPHVLAIHDVGTHDGLAYLVSELLEGVRGRVTRRGTVIRTEYRHHRRPISPAVGYDPVLTRIYMGDYIDMKTGMSASGRTSDFFLAWTDCRRFITTGGGTRPDQDVFFSRQ